MQAADGAGVEGKRPIVLHEGRVHAERLVPGRAERLAERAPHIAQHMRNSKQHTAEF